MLLGKELVQKFSIIFNQKLQKRTWVHQRASTINIHNIQGRWDNNYIMGESISHCQISRYSWKDKNSRTKNVTITNIWYCCPGNHFIIKKNEFQLIKNCFVLPIVKKSVLVWERFLTPNFIAYWKRYKRGQFLTFFHFQLICLHSLAYFAPLIALAWLKLPCKESVAGKNPPKTVPCRIVAANSSQNLNRNETTGRTPWATRRVRTSHKFYLHTLLFV